MKKRSSRSNSISGVAPRNRNRVQSVERALAVLRSFSPETPKWSVTSLSDHLHLPKTIVTRLLATLEDARFVEQDTSDRSYYLGRRIYELAGSYANRNELIRISNAFLVQLVAQTGFTAQVSVLDGKEIVCLAASESSMVVRAVFYPGLRRPIHATASGKVLLSGLSDEAIRALLADEKLAPITSNTITDIEELLKHLNTVRRQGYATNYGESIDGLIAIAAPVRNYQGQVIAAVSLGFPKQFVTDDQIPVLLQHVVNTTQQISQRLGACTQFR